MQDLIIIGGGPAAAAGAVYAARKQLTTTLIAREFGGQSVDSTDVQNWLGIPHISGYDLGKSFEAHVRTYAEPYVTLALGALAEKVEKIDGGFRVQVGATTYETRAVFIGTGGKRRTLDIPGAKEFENKGVTYCASCDGPMFGGQDVAVIGGGNAGFESAAQLLAYAKSVTLINRAPECGRADAKTVAAVLANPHFKVLNNTIPVAVKGETMVNALVVKDTTTNEETTLPVTGLFIEIGMLPATDLVASIVERNQEGKIKVDPRTQRTSSEGIWAAGDCTDGLYHQNNIAAGDAVKALEDLYIWIKANTPTV